MHDSVTGKRKHDSTTTDPPRSRVLFSKYIALFNIHIGADGRPRITWLDPNTADIPSPEKRAKTETISDPVEAKTEDEEELAAQVEAKTEDGEEIAAQVEAKTGDGEEIAAQVETRSDHGRELQAVLDGEECSICYEPYRRVEDMTILPCEHYFHKECVNGWLAIDNTCPVCRMNAGGSHEKL